MHLSRVSSVNAQKALENMTKIILRYKQKGYKTIKKAH